jgi:uncharacterized protein (TIGR00369 family)
MTQHNEWEIQSDTPASPPAIRIESVAIRDGKAVFVATPHECHFNPAGLLPCGHVAMLLDWACAWAVHSQLVTEQTYATRDIKIAYYSPVCAGIGPLRVEARLLSFGLKTAFAEAELIDSSGTTLYATAKSSLLVLDKTSLRPCASISRSDQTGPRNGRRDKLGAAATIMTYP